MGLLRTAITVFLRCSEVEQIHASFEGNPDALSQRFVTWIIQ